MCPTFSPDEDREVMRLSAELRIPINRRVPGGELVKAWKDIVNSIEQGYRLTADDYGNDLDLRQLLEEVRSRASPNVQRKLDQFLDPMDKRFVAATRRTKQPLLGDPNTAEWWWWRVPLRDAPELERTLRARHFDLSLSDA